MGSHSKFTALLLLTILTTHSATKDRWAGVPTPPCLENPPAYRLFELVIIIGGSLIMAVAIANSIRNRRLTYSFLFLFNSLICYWQETIGDWGQHLIYSPRFMRHHLLEWLPIKSPNDPIFVPFAYAVYWTAHSIMLMQLAPILQRYFKRMTLLQAVLVLSLPLNYSFDIVVEGFCTYMGYWTYDPGMGPVIKWSTGGRQPLTWPILLMSGWPNLIAYWGGKPPLTSLNIIERWSGLERLTEPQVPYAKAHDRLDPEYASEASPLLDRPKSSKGKAWTDRWNTSEEYDAKLNYKVKDSVPRWLFETARFVAWLVVFNVSFFITLVIPLVVLRVATGRGSKYVP
ncbi:hypothetical protein BU16DRAFT_533687 [Lophium mytilinum]|uniref:Integral membrane protein n=1 Tax=Lophium mytilinum TaxID=390894 RepID=A0A6A6R8Z0_9PEZI|nr:hypothetical protein BU16DRAFT_533687 [Lophium mytilinum]